jgi:hypothetical protein
MAKRSSYSLRTFRITCGSIWPISYPILEHPILAHPILAHPILAHPILAHPILAHPFLAHPIRRCYPNLLVSLFVLNNVDVIEMPQVCRFVYKLICTILIQVRRKNKKN